MRIGSQSTVSQLFTLLCLALLFVGCADSSQVKPNPEAAKQLLKLRGYEFNEKSFFAAAATNDLWAVNTFLAAGINPNSAGPNGETVLMQAAGRGNIEIIVALMNSGADVNALDNKGHTALVWAADNRDGRVAKALLANAKMDVNKRSAHGTGIVAIYVARDREDVLLDLLEKGADVDAQDNDGDTALHGAALNGNSKVIRLLLDNGADPNLRNKLGGTALMWAVSYGHAEASRLLLDKGADPGVKDIDGLTAADWAVKNKRVELARLLEEAERQRRGSR